MAIGEYTKAIEDFSKEIEYSPDDAEFYYKRATALYCLSLDNEANEDLKMANKLDPKYTNELFLSQFPN
jgi:tetratricopeptide (TPR) repeat protein